jgi:hypothetical protein
MRIAALLLAMTATVLSHNEGIHDECVDCTLDKDLLWPPNHKLVDVGLHVDIHTDPSATHVMDLTVYSDEDDVWPAGGRFSPDSSLTTGDLRLRAERSGRGDGRVYLIVVAVTDTDNATGDSHVHHCVFTVVVPHDMSAKSVASVHEQADAAHDYWTEHGAAPPGFFVVGDGPVVGPKQ